MAANRIQLQNGLQKPYDRVLFSKEVLSPVFGASFTLNSSLVQASVLPNKSESVSIDKVWIYGNILLDDSTEITCFEVLLQPKVNIEQSKVAIQHYVRKLLVVGQAALINFVAPSNKNVWRLTLVAKDSELTVKGVKEKTTNPKRYTFLLGPTETCKTAAERFEILSTEKEISFQTLVNTFSVEKLSKAFFNEYTLHYQNFCNYLQESNYRKSVFNITFPVDATKQEKDKASKPIRDFVKKLLGRIVFLYFVQKKGWLGATDTNYANGQNDFIKQLFEKAGGNDTFYSNWLTVLFFDTLNKERLNDDFVMPDGKTVKVPFLNGGLFEKEDYDQFILTFKSVLFHNPEFEDTILTEKNIGKARGFFDFLDSFNFTIYEDSPDDHTVAVDPEMLGHIFENLLEDNKDKGAFYTPKEIVHYMCQESLTEYLCTTLQIKDEVAEREAVNLLLKNKIVDDVLRPEIVELEKALDQVKICDPAIGSGAFPMGLLQEIFSIKELIAYETGKEWNPAETKLNIIQNSIYGVDIEKGAVDIARLRFWLSLVVDEEKPKALPNLDYKIVVGDSLISKFDGEIIEIDWDLNEGTQTDLFGNDNLQKRKQILEKLTEKQRIYFNPNHVNKKDLSFEIRNLKIDVLINQLELMIKTEKMEQAPIRNDFKDTKKFLKAQELFQITEGWRCTIRKLQQIKVHPNAQFNHFDWKLDFPEVLNPYLVNGKGGFDIVIGNPPYLNFKMYSTEDKEVYRHLFSEVFDGKADIYYYFFYKSHELSKSQGITSLITSRYWIEAEYAKKLRKFVSTKTTLKEIIDFKNVTVFDGIGIKTCITSFLNIPDYLTLFHYRFHPGKKIDYIDLSEYVSNIIPKENIITKDSWNLTNEESTDILILIEKDAISLEEIANCKQGIVTGLDKAFITSENEFKNLPKKIVKPWLKVGDIQKYAIVLVEKRELVYTKLINSIDDYPQLKQRLHSFKTKLSNRREAKNGKIRWFDLQWPREQELFESEKLICRFKAYENTFCYDANGFYSSADTTVVALNESGKDKYETKYLLALLNSKVLSFYFKSYGKLMDYRYEYYPGPVGRLRIKITTEQKCYSTIVDYILFLKTQELQSVSDQLMPSYFEQIIDGMVYELYFPELIKKHNCEIIEHLGELPELTEEMSDEQKMEISKEAFDRLNDDNHPVKINLKKMKEEIQEIRIIEGLEN
jgi:hypothetical protein